MRSLANRAYRFGVAHLEPAGSWRLQVIDLNDAADELLLVLERSCPTDDDLISTLLSRFVPSFAVALDASRDPVRVFSLCAVQGYSTFLVADTPADYEYPDGSRACYSRVEPLWCAKLGGTKPLFSDPQYEPMFFNANADGAAKLLEVLRLRARRWDIHQNASQTLLSFIAILAAQAGILQYDEFPPATIAPEAQTLQGGQVVNAAG